MQDIGRLPLANVPAKPLPLLVSVVMTSSGEDDFVVVLLEPNPNEVLVDDLSAPNPDETAPNPNPKPVVVFVSESPLLFLSSAFFSVVDGFNAPNPLDTLPNPDPNPPNVLVAALPNPDELDVLPAVDPNVGILLDPKIGMLPVASFSELFVAVVIVVVVGARLTEANIPPLVLAPFPPLDHLLLALTIFRFLRTSSSAHSIIYDIMRRC